MKLLIIFIKCLHRCINYFTLKKNGVEFKKFTINGVISIINKKGKLILGNNFSANSGKRMNPIGGDTILNLIVFNAAAELIIGDNVGISNSTIICWKKIEIGNNVVIGGGCRIWDTNFHSTDAVMRTSGNDTDIKTSPIKINDNVFIGGGSIILKGVNIGENTIIAAGSVIHKNIPANVIAGGNPCVVIKEIPISKK